MDKVPPVKKLDPGRDIACVLVLYFKYTAFSDERGTGTAPVAIDERTVNIVAGLAERILDVAFTTPLAGGGPASDVETEYYRLSPPTLPCLRPHWLPLSPEGW